LYCDPGYAALAEDHYVSHRVTVAYTCTLVL
jgi:hypothetical protein